MMYAFAYTLLEYLNFGMAYAVVFHRKLRKKVYIYMFTLGLICLFQFMILHMVDDTWLDIVNVLGGFFIPLFWLEKRRFMDFLLMPVAVMGTSFVNTFGSYFWAFVFGKSQRVIVETPSYTLLAECTAIIVMIIYLFWKRKKQYAMTLQMSKGQYLLLVTGFLCFGIIIAFFQGLEEGTNYFQSRAGLFGMAMTGTCVAFQILCVWQIFTLRRQEEYRKKSEAYENYMQLQEMTIRQRIEKDENMRRFRHDLHAHITALGAIAERIGDQELFDYIAGMEGSVLYREKRYSGIAAVDAIVADIEETAKLSGIHIQWDGMLGGTKEIAVFDLCTIFSNLLTNAVEACEKSIQKERIILVKVYCYETSVYIVVKNSYSGTLNFRADGTIVTDKEDSSNHGFGMKNVWDTVKKNGGSVVYTTENGWFEVKIVL